jgi:hypothetical protein
MKGKIIIEHDESGTSIAVQMKGTTDNDRLFLVHALGKSLGLGPLDYAVLIEAEAAGVLDNEVALIDAKELKKQMEEEQLES